MRFMQSDTLLGLDIGSSKICASIGKYDKITDRLKIIGIGMSDTNGVSKGIVTDLHALSDSITAAVNNAQKQAQTRVYSAYISLSGKAIEKGLYSQARLLSTRGKSVTRGNVNELIEATRMLSLSMGEDALHVIPHEYILDGQKGIKDPVGLYGIRLEVELYIIKVLNSVMQNMIKACDYSGLYVEEGVFTGLADGLSLLDQRADTKRKSIIVDIGSGITAIALFEDDMTLKDTAIVLLGGADITCAIADKLNLQKNTAEELKKRSVSLGSDPRQRDAIADILKESPKEDITIKDVNKIAKSASEDMFVAIKEKMLGFQDKKIADDFRMVFTGGGTLLDGFLECGEQILGVPVEMGFSRDIQASSGDLGNPLYTASFGLLKYAARKRRSRVPRSQGGMIKDVALRVKDFMEDYF